MRKGRKGVTYSSLSPNYLPLPLLFLPSLYRSNFVGTAFVVYDAGEDPFRKTTEDQPPPSTFASQKTRKKEGRSEGETEEAEVEGSKSIRQELAAVIYVSCKRREGKGSLGVSPLFTEIST